MRKMIHYHGGPIWPENAAATIWNRRHGFVSFARPEQIGVAAEACQSFALDNGAFTAWKSGKQYDFDGYEAWVEAWRFHPNFDWCLIPDKIDGTEAENYELVTNWKFPTPMSVPVWHLHESMEYLEFLSRAFPRIALGSSGEYASVGTKGWWVRVAEAMEILCIEGKPVCKLHGLRMLNPSVFTKLPFSSADSTNVAQNARDSARWVGAYKPPNTISRGCLIADRIEHHNSSPLWVKEILNK